ncbi:hypothetical protein GPUN_2512 [Glaciecola punicea ACAM 611]|uniref:Uncharacterized protein n=1 Tax=Glaciecola punicea ACAM 611 TaxID=1121923 RepID=H5TEA0_9ALTE|nr:hypothetical protein [Glaciecola punicea]GAB56627.1 hypothetical protein GPUN_2512 [Glaciecola punicea ACAM 611]
MIEIRSGSGIYGSKDKPNKKFALDDTGIGPFEILEIRLIIESATANAAHHFRK